MIDYRGLAKRVKRGVRLLDRKVPNWRSVLRRHSDQFEFECGDRCVLGTLEHYSGRMCVLRERRKTRIDLPFDSAKASLGIDRVFEYGFDHMPQSIEGGGGSDEYPILDALWRAEFEK